MLTCSACGKKDKTTKKYAEFDMKKTHNLCDICHCLRQLATNAELFDAIGAEDFKKELDTVYIILSKELKRRIVIDRDRKKKTAKKKTAVFSIFAD